MTANRTVDLVAANRTVRYLNKIFVPISQIAITISSVFIAATMFLTAADVISRNLFNRPITGSMEVIQLMMSAVFGFGLAYCAVKKGHIRIDIIYAYVSQPAQRALDILSYFAAFGFCCLITWFTFQKGRVYLFNEETASQTLTVPIYPFAFLLSLSMAMLALVFLKDLIESIAGDIKK